MNAKGYGCPKILGKSSELAIVLAEGIIKFVSTTSFVVTMDSAAARDHLTRVFLETGCDLLCIGLRANVSTRIQAFKSNFKYGPSRCAYLYLRIRDHPALPDGFLPVHLLWTLYFLVTYATERRLCCVLKANRKTIRKYTWPTITALASLADVHVSKNTAM